MAEWQVNQHFQDDLCSPHQFHDEDEDRHGLRYVALLTIQPPGAAASPEIFYYNLDCSILDYDTLQTCMLIITFWRNQMPPFWQQMMETADTSELLADTCKATHCHNPEQWNLKTPITLKHYVMRPFWEITIYYSWLAEPGPIRCVLTCIILRKHMQVSKMYP